MSWIAMLGFTLPPMFLVHLLPKDEPLQAKGYEAVGLAEAIDEDYDEDEEEEDDQVVYADVEPEVSGPARSRQHQTDV